MGKHEGVIGKGKDLCIICQWLPEGHSIIDRIEGLISCTAQLLLTVREDVYMEQLHQK